MSQENKEKKFKDNGLMMKIAFTSLLTALLMMIEIYEIINDSANLIAIGSLGVFILVSVFSTALLIGRLNELKAKQQEEAFDNVLRSEKASYLLMRKYFDKMEQKMDSALIKCIEEEKTGNTDFRSAKESIVDALHKMELVEAEDFMRDFLPAYGKTLDELRMEI